MTGCVVFFLNALKRWNVHLTKFTCVHININKYRDVVQRNDYNVGSILCFVFDLFWLCKTLVIVTLVVNQY